MQHNGYYYRITSNRDVRARGEWRNELPVQISGDKDRYAGPDERLMSRSMEHHGGAEPALRVADVVKVSIDQRDIAMWLLLRGRGETESREGRKARTTGTREERAWSEGRVGKPKRIGFEEGECGAVRGISVAIACDRMGGSGGGEESLRIGDPGLM